MPLTTKHGRANKPFNSPFKLSLKIISIACGTSLRNCLIAKSSSDLLNVSLFFVDHQQWYEYRRTGLPVLPNNGGLQNNGQMPMRFMYPTQTKVMNTENYNAAVQSMGGDNINVKMWWNKP